MPLALALILLAQWPSPAPPSKKDAYWNESRDRLRSPVLEVRVSAACALARRDSPYPQEGVPQLIEGLVYEMFHRDLSGKRYHLRDCTLSSIKTLGIAEAVVPHLIDALSDRPDIEIDHDLAAEVLSSLGREGVPAMVLALRHEKSLVRFIVVRALGQQEGAKAALPELRLLAARETGSLRSEVLHVINGMEERRGFEADGLRSVAAEFYGPVSAPVTSSAIDYDTFMKADPAARRDAFAKLSAEQKADLMRTHMQRWRAAHERKLTKEQRQVVDDNIAAIAPDFYRQPTTPEWRNKAVSLFKRASGVFTQEEMTQLFTLDGAYVPEAR